MMGLRATKAMGVKWVLGLLIHSFLPYFLHAQDSSYPTSSTANLSSSWINTGELSLSDGSFVQTILRINNYSDSNPEGLAMACGFFANQTHDSSYFITFAIRSTMISGFSMWGKPRVLWSANRDNPVSKNATLNLTSDGDLVLRDVGGALVWSTNSSGKSVVGMNITETGNLVLFDKKNAIIWQSFDHPTDTWLPGQKLMAGQRLIASVSKSNWTRGLFYISVTDNGLYAYVESSPPQMYYKFFRDGTRNTSLKTGMLEVEASGNHTTVNFTSLISNFQYLRLDSDGHLRAYQDVSDMEKIDDILTDYLSACEYPTVCGNYGICSDKLCNCPIGINGDPNYFKFINPRQPNFGCIETTQLSCNYLDLHYLQELPNVSYFSFVPVLSNIDVQSCKNACLKNCSCKAALFRYSSNVSNGDCSILSQLFSLMNVQERKVNYKISTFIKVQRPFVTPIAPTAPSSKRTDQRKGGPVHEAPANAGSGEGKRTDHVAIIVGPIMGTVILTSLIIIVYVTIYRKGKDDEGVERDGEEEVMYSLDQVSGFPMRLSYEDLKSATRNFQVVLGRGGFGSVFEGNLDNGDKVAVKRLDGFGQGKKEFLAEVKTIGKIHHINLVRLVGFCVEKSQRLLVYEYMCNGSLDKWIFSKNQEPLDWETRRKIIIGIAKGLEYLHEHCKQRIVHRDIKPQNILLDGNFDAKISDFGLARLMDRDQSQVETRMKGTLGYLAPEWRLGKGITEKVDVYAFGVVILEIMCGRKNLDYSQPEENDCLQHIVQKKAEKDQLFDVVDKNSQDIKQHREQSVKMIRIAIWCLQSDCTRRPTMSMVVKVLEGLMDMEPISDYSFLNLMPMENPRIENPGASTLILPSILSGPR